ncbi:unnamed protein product [Paramecium octaurelia]|uniref:Uncharacterized protein n=1 Tax=Paramecium octaurelia TaxID=43137 RepID=A0A8S1YL38_PAROT|nr:unnamed protein product [Paramecium octaurelia]CAD8215107.1 unnamed protein product [Paramecium octaurelia]CAD8215516.1 unnamed protein product [Paramecium octaurelia]
MQAVQEVEALTHSEQGDVQGRHDEPERYWPASHDVQKHHKLSIKSQQLNNDPHKFNIQNYQYKLRSKWGMNYNSMQLYNTQENNLSRKVHFHHYKLRNQMNNYCIALQVQHNMLSYKYHTYKELYKLCNLMSKVYNRRQYQLLLDCNFELLEQNKVSLHKQFIKIRLRLNRKLYINIINNIQLNR